MSEREGSVTPSPPPPPPERQPTGSFHPHEPGDLQDALRIGREGRRRVAALEAAFAKEIGRDPDPKRGDDDKGEGIRGRVGMLEDTVGDAGDPIRKRPASGLVGGHMALSESVDALTAELRLDRETREKWYRRGGVVIMAIVVAAALGAGSLAWQWASTLRHVPAPQGHLDRGGGP